MNLEENKKVEVYFNLHKKMFSIRDFKTKIVITHLDELNLKNVVFKVNQKGRERVLKEKRKNVHAYLIGDFTLKEENDSSNFKEAYYNTYKTKEFIDKESSQELRQASFVKCFDKRISYKI